MLGIALDFLNSGQRFGQRRGGLETTKNGKRGREIRREEEEEEGSRSVGQPDRRLD